MKRYAIGDIHGGYFTFHALINQICPKHDDRVYLLGDYIDRGADSCGVLELIIRMQEAGCAIYPVRGNHDDMLLRNITGQHDNYSAYWIKGWGPETLKSFGIAAVEEMPYRYLNFLQSLPYVRLEHDYVFVHAALDMRKNNPITESDPTGMMWEKIGDIDPQRLGNRKLVTGHKIRTMPSIIASLQTNHFELDNGAYSDLDSSIGSLVALNLDTMELTAQRWLDGEAWG